MHSTTLQQFKAQTKLLRIAAQPALLQSFSASFDDSIHFGWGLSLNWKQQNRKGYQKCTLDVFSGGSDVASRSVGREKMATRKLAAGALFMTLPVSIYNWSTCVSPANPSFWRMFSFIWPHLCRLCSIRYLLYLLLCAWIRLYRMFGTCIKCSWPMPIGVLKNGWSSFRNEVSLIKLYPHGYTLVFGNWMWPPYFHILQKTKHNLQDIYEVIYFKEPTIIYCKHFGI